MIDDIQICSVLRNFQSDSDDLQFGDFWIEKLTSKDKKNLSHELHYFNNYPCDNHLLIKWDHIGRGNTGDFLIRRIRIFWLPLFRLLKLFKSGNLIMTIGFLHSNNKWREIRIQDEDFFGLSDAYNNNPYIFNKSDIVAFKTFCTEINDYLKYLNFSVSPFRKTPEPLHNIDFRCLLATHILLKGSIGRNDNIFVFDRLIEIIYAFESLYLDRDNRKKEPLASRASTVLSKNENEKQEVYKTLKMFYEIRNDIVHGSLIEDKDEDYLRNNIFILEDYLRKSILAFLDLNLIKKTKPEVLGLIKKAGDNPQFKNEIRGKLKILNLAN